MQQCYQQLYYSSNERYLPMDCYSQQDLSRQSFSGPTVTTQSREALERLARQRNLTSEQEFIVVDTLSCMMRSKHTIQRTEQLSTKHQEQSKIKLSGDQAFSERDLRRKAKLLYDDCAVEIRGESQMVECFGCHGIFTLEKRGHYYPRNFWKHKSNCKLLRAKVATGGNWHHGAITQRMFEYGVTDIESTERVASSDEYLRYI